VDSSILGAADVDPYVSEDGNLWIPIAVGDCAGYYAVHLHKVVGNNGRLYTPTGFECAGGKENNRKWRLSLRVLLPDGRKGRTLGQWLISHGLDHLVPAVGSSPNKNSKSSSPEKRMLQLSSPSDSPTKTMRRGTAISRGGMFQSFNQPPSPSPADVIGNFLQQHLAIRSPSAPLAPSSSPIKTSALPPHNVECYEGPSKPPGTSGTDAASSSLLYFPALRAMQNPTHGTTVSTGVPVLSSRVIGHSMQHKPSPTTSPDKAIDHNVGIPNKEPSVVLKDMPPIKGEHSGSSIDLARVFDYGDCPTALLLHNAGFSPSPSRKSNQSEKSDKDSPGISQFRGDAGDLTADVAVPMKQRRCYTFPGACHHQWAHSPTDSPGLITTWTNEEVAAAFEQVSERKEHEQVEAGRSPPSKSLLACEHLEGNQEKSRMLERTDACLGSSNLHSTRR
jgi:hypothetical protein